MRRVLAVLAAVVLIAMAGTGLSAAPPEDCGYLLTATVLRIDPESSARYRQDRVVDIRAGLFPTEEEAKTQAQQIGTTGLWAPDDGNRFTPVDYFPPSRVLKVRMVWACVP